MYGRTISYGLNGIDAEQITVEADIRGGLSKFIIVGLPSNSIKESRERVSAAITNSGFKFSPRHYTINLAPADLRKEGVALDLATAVAILSASRQIKSDTLGRFALIGELSLEGKLLPVKGILSMSTGAWKDNLDGIIVPRDNVEEAAVIEGLNVYPVSSLEETVEFLENRSELQPVKVDIDKLFTADNMDIEDLNDVKGQYHVKRALEVAAAGGHNIMMIGPPGAGKTMLARRLPGILPEMTLDEALTTTKIHSVAGMITGNHNGLMNTRPFRSPHHTISDIALIGGGSYPKPGEVSLAHNGVLFLDELPEFKKSVLEVLRQPLEDEIVNISRASNSLTFPACFMLVASMNPCPCGYFGNSDGKHSCNCAYTAIQKYRSRISGPLMDRIDIQIEVPAVKYSELSSLPTGENSFDIRQRVNHSRIIQTNRFDKDNIFSNSQMNTKLLRKYCKLDNDSKDLLKLAMIKKGLSARAYDRIIKVARTISDLEQSTEIKPNHISEAVMYRSLDTKIWE